MCGKFTQLFSWDQIGAFTQSPEAMVGPSITVTPMRMAHVIRLDQDGKRQSVPMRWGFADRQAQSPLEKPKHMHARAETIDTRPTFAGAFAHARGIVPVVSFNEGEELPNGKTKQYVISPKDKKRIGIAIIWEEWRSRDGSLLTFVMVTTPPNELIGTITDRMPAIVKGEDWPLWLGETDAPLDDVKALLKAYDDGGNWEMKEQESTKPQRPHKPDREPQLF